MALVLPPYSNNPGRDADIYFDRLENLACLHCVVCDTSLYDGDEYYEIDDQCYCPECMNDEFRKVVDLSEPE